MLKQVAKQEGLGGKGKKRPAPADEDEDEDISDIDDASVDDDEQIASETEEEENQADKKNDDVVPPAKKKKVLEASEATGGNEENTAISATGDALEVPVQAEKNKTKKKRDRERTRKKKELKAQKVKAAVGPELEADAARREARDARTLFVKNMPANADEAALRALHPAVQAVRIHHQRNQQVEKHFSYAFLEFADDAAADAAHAALQGVQVGGKTLVVDFVGAKSTQQKKRTSGRVTESPVDPLKLYVSCLPSTVTAASLKALCPASADVHLPVRAGATLGYAFIFFSTQAAAKEAHARLSDSEYEGHKLVVLFAKKTKDVAGSRAAPRKERSGQAQSHIDEKKKVAATAAAAEQEDDEDDESMDDDDDEEEDDA